MIQLLIHIIFTLKNYSFNYCGYKNQRENDGEKAKNVKVFSVKCSYFLLKKLP